jgi:hypothetical protein
MKKRIGIGVGLVALAGIIDVIPMVLQDLTWDANISAFIMWVVIGFLLSVTDIKLNSILKGIFISFLVLVPAAILIGWNEPTALIPIVIMTTILGGLLGFAVNRFAR